ncbi:MAG: hypothetical protein IJR79_02355 [Clostridia bacterium]|nr:hypothetical protein [Clostridia bacterium]
MEITQNAFGDYLISKNGINKGYTLKILGVYKVFNRKGVLIGHILKRDKEYISYDGIGNAIERGEFDKLLLNFFKQKKGI